MEVNNVYIFVADALRWDFLPPSVANMGTVIKSVAASTLSPASFASIVSGQVPPKHGVHTFGHKLSTDRNHLLNIGKVNSSFWQFQSKDPIYDVLTQDPSHAKRVDKMDPPFINIERELATHAPYGVSSAEESSHGNDAGRFIKSRSGNLSELKDTYQRGSELAAEVFKQRLQALKDRDLLNETLVIFTSDHGELLGEYASSSHTYPMVPESVYVPTVFIPPGNTKLKIGGVFSHVDILATVVDVLDIETPCEPQGISAFSKKTRDDAFTSLHFPKNTAAFGDSDSILDRYEITHHGLWESKGGWVFDRSSILGKTANGMKNIIPYSARKRNLIRQNPREYGDLLRLCMQRVSVFGDPELSKEQAIKSIDRTLEESNEEEKKAIELGEEKIDHLRDLGYK